MSDVVDHLTAIERDELKAERDTVISALRQCVRAIDHFLSEGHYSESCPDCDLAHESLGNAKSTLERYGEK